jgi:hypothetical protein
MTRVDGCPDLSMWATEATARRGSLDLVGAEILGVIRAAIDAHPRSTQKEIGPSELGHPCSRWLAHKLAGTPVTGLQMPPWRQAVGTAVHEQFSAWCHQFNATHGTRYLTDIRVWVGDLYPGRPITGTLDCLDILTATIIDLKVPGTTAMKTYGHGKPESPQYDTQTDSYGVGATNAGFPVDNVAVLRVPACGEFADAVWKARPHNPGRAATALARVGGIARLVDALGSAAIPLQPTTEHYCGRCDYYQPDTTDLLTSCPGAESFIAAREARNVQPSAQQLMSL